MKRREPLTPGARLKWWREFRGYTREQLSMLTTFEISSQYIYLIEKGDRPLSMNNALTLAPALAVMPVTLLHGDESACPFCGRGGEDDGGDDIQ